MKMGRLITLTVCFIILISTTTTAQNIEREWVITETISSGINHYFSNLVALDDVILFSMVWLDTDAQHHILLYAYNTNGTLMWDKDIAFPGEEVGFTKIVQADSTNVYVVSFITEPNSYYGYFNLLKVSTDGNIVWSETHGENAKFNDCVVDPEGNLYVTGKQDEHLVLKKWDKNGNLIADVAYEEAETASEGSAIKIDNTGNVVVFGFYRFPGIYGCSPIVFSTTGTIIQEPKIEELVDTAADFSGLSIGENDDIYTVSTSYRGRFLTKWNTGYQTWQNFYDILGGAVGVSDTIFQEDKVIFAELVHDLDDNVSFKILAFDSLGNESWDIDFDNTSILDLMSSNSFFLAAGSRSSTEDKSYTGVYAGWIDSDGQIIKEDVVYDEQFSISAGHVATNQNDTFLFGFCRDESGNSYYVLIKYSAQNSSDNCEIDNLVYSAGQRHPDNPCLVCDPEQNTSEWSEGDGLSCSNGLYCDGDSDVCVAGQCIGNVDPCEDGQTCDEDKNSCENLDGDVTGNNFAQDEDNGGCCG